MKVNHSHIFKNTEVLYNISYPYQTAIFLHAIPPYRTLFIKTTKRKSITSLQYRKQEHSWRRYFLNTARLSDITHYGVQWVVWNDRPFRRVTCPRRFLCVYVHNMCTWKILFSRKYILSQVWLLLMILRSLTLVIIILTFIVIILGRWH